MYKIGEFSRLSRITVKTLRHYDEAGLLRPAYVDRFSGYRYYSAGQLPDLYQILSLKDLGLSLEQIRTLL
ncbi:MAG: MerR family transcriptional regulator, partial [Anaerolineae bacterium]|nr:MerR family transcriptional regulator [Anaerolineae bacterium]